MSLRLGMAVAAVLLAVAGSTAARPVALRGGHGGDPPGGEASMCDSGSSVCAFHRDGQTFVTWTDMDTGSAGNNWRYWVRRSASPIGPGDYGSAQLVASHIFNNSAQLVGGRPDVLGGDTFTQANRQSATLPMVRLSDLGSAVDYGTGIQAYTAVAPGNAYYAVIAKSCPGGTCSDGAETFIGSVGPIAESVAEPRPIKYADSLSRSAGSYGRINEPVSSLPVVFTLHASSAAGGAATNSQYGDYWTWFLTRDEGWFDGRQAPMSALLDKAQNYAQYTFVLGHRDTIWNSLGSGSQETYHLGIGMSPVDGRPANRLYLTTQRGIERMARWAIDYYGLDANQLHASGTSMGAWGSANAIIRATNPRFASIWPTMPVWRMDLRGSAGWPGSNWTNSMPFRATLGSCPSCLGTVRESVLLEDGTVWGGTGAYADTPAFIAADPGNDLPFTAWMLPKDDNFNGTNGFGQHIAALNAFQSARRGHAFIWNMGDHDTPSAMEVINCDRAPADTGVCYSKPLFRLNLPYIAFTNSSIDDNPGTGARGSNGLYDGDYYGCVNCGNKWSITSDSAGEFAFTVSNAWMGRSPTTLRQSTTTGSIAASGSGTVTVADASVFLSATSNPYFLVNGLEVIKVTAINTGTNTLTFSSRGQLGSTPQAHSSGVTIRQFVSRPTGPNGGPYATMTADLTPRRIQNFARGKTNGEVITCTITPHGGSPSEQTPTVANGLFTLTGVTINASGATSVACE